MTGDLVSLRILLVSGVMAERELLRRAAAQATVPIDVLEADTVVAARPMLAANDIDIAFCNAAVSASDLAAFVTDSRKARVQPFVILVAASKDEAAAMAANAGVDGVVARPADATQARVLMERCIHVRLPKRIMIVDDSLTMRSIVRKILAASRFRMDIVEAQEGIAALKQLATGKYDVVFLDYNMPGINGVETLSEIRRQYPRLGVVIMTSTADEELAERARLAGASAFLKKPFYPADIDAILHRILGLHPSV
ncbi:MAG: response regulator [Xanthobacteraceae bacterium]